MIAHRNRLDVCRVASAWRPIASAPVRLLLRVLTQPPATVSWMGRPSPDRSPVAVPVTAALLLAALTLSATAQTLDSRRAGRMAAGTAPVAPPTIQSADGSGQTADPWPPALLGGYTAAVQCNGRNIWLDAEVAADGQASLVAQAEPAAGQLAQRALWPAEAWRASYDPGGQWMVMTAGPQGRGMSIELALADDSGQWVGRVRGRGWESCSPILMLRPDAAQAMRDELPEPTPSRSGNLLSRMPFGGLLKRLTQRSQCDRDTLTWVNQFLDQVEALGPRPSAQQLRRETVSMFAAEVFDRSFGKPLKDIDVDEARQISSIVMSAMGCDMTPQRRALAGNTVQYLTQPLLNNGGLNRQYVVLDLASRPLLAQWSEQMTSQAAAWASADEELVDLTRLDGATAAWAAFGQAAAGSDVDSRQTDQGAAAPDPGREDVRRGSQGSARDAVRARDRWGARAADAASLRSDPVSRSLASTRQRVLAAQASRALVAQAEQVGSDLDALQQLVMQLSPGGANPAVDSVAQAAVADRVDALLPEAATSWAARAQGTAGWQQLANWRQRYQALLAVAGQAPQAAAQAAIDTRKLVLGESIVQAWRSEYLALVGSRPAGVEALAAGTALESQWRSDTALLAQLPSVAAFAAERAARRARDLNAATPALVAMAAQAPHLSALTELRQRHLLPGEGDTPAARALASAIGARQQLIAPFAAMPAADYLNAMYGADYQRLRELDLAFREPYKTSMLPALQHTAPLVNALAAFAGMRLNYGAAMAKAMDGISLIAPMFAVYLVEYEGRLGQCLESDAKEFKITQTSETVYRDGHGTFKYSVKHPDQISYFTVNRRFAHVFESVGLSNPQSVLANILDQSFRSQGRVGIGDLVAGTRALMKQFDEEGCASPRMQRMEEHMLAFFDAYRQSNRAVLDAMFGR